MAVFELSNLVPTSLTARQKLIYDFLRQEKTAQSAYDILDAVRDHGIRAPSQIYRELNKLLDGGFVHKVESLNAFIACRQNHDIGQSVVTICNSCGLVKEISAPDFSGYFDTFDNLDDFSPQEVTVEVKGSCSVCN